MLATEIRGFGAEENSIKLGFLPGWHISFLRVKAGDWRHPSQAVACGDKRGQGLLGVQDRAPVSAWGCWGTRLHRLVQGGGERTAQPAVSPQPPGYKLLVTQCRVCPRSCKMMMQLRKMLDRCCGLS